jgi:glucose-6-phosphate-specific signal transduction histidine kinase
VRVELQIGAGVLSLEVSDNGCGIAPPDLAKARSFGIRGLHERASTVEGWVDLTSGGSGSGTTLILSVPLGPPEDRDDDDHGDDGEGGGVGDVGAMPPPAAAPT